MLELGRGAMHERSECRQMAVVRETLYEHVQLGNEPEEGRAGGRRETFRAVPFGPAEAPVQGASPITPVNRSSEPSTPALPRPRILQVNKVEHDAALSRAVTQTFNATIVNPPWLFSGSAQCTR